MSKYPRVGGVSAKSKNTSAKCKCGAVAKYKTTVEVNIFRGDDEVVWSCNEHKSKRAARTVLTGMCYSFGNATRQGSSSLTRFIGQSAITSSTWRR